MAGKTSARVVDGALVAYRLGGTDGSRSSRFSQAIFGQDATTGKYSYRKRGLLDQIPHWRVQRGLLVVRAVDRPKLVKGLRAWEAEVHWWPIPLTPSDLRHLGMPEG